MVDQLDLFATTNTDYEEEQRTLTRQREIAKQLEERKKAREEFFNEKLTTRQHRLRDWLEDNFIPGRFFSIEEICAAGLGYTLNTNLRVHDKCAALGADVRAINWQIADRYKIIIKDSKGGCKLAESKKEVDDWIQSEKDKLEKKYQYLNTIKWKEERDGTVPVVNLKDRALTPEETKEVEVYKK